VVVNRLLLGESKVLGVECRGLGVEVGVQALLRMVV
jgi:hypothetical protein